MDSAATSHRARRRAGLSTSLCVLLASLLLCVGTFMLVRPCYPLADDYVQQLYVSGRLLGCGACGLMPYTLWPISAPMSALYQVLPAVPWYAITLLALTTVSFWACGTQALRSRLSAPAKACVCMALGALEVISTMYFTYTVVAFLATSAGLATLVERSSFGREGLGVPDACALALVCLGFALRPESGLGALAVFSPFAVYVIAHNRHAAPICRGVVTVLAALAVMAAGGLAYDATPGWESYGDYLGHGRDALDYPELTADEMREIDPSITDASASILNKWIFIQSDPFDVEFFERLGSSRAHVSRAYLLDALKAKTTWLALGLIALFGVAGAAMMRNVHASSAARALAMGVCVMALASCLLLATRARVRLHVVLPLAMTTFMALIACCQAPEAKRGAHYAHRAVSQSRSRSRLRRLALPVVVGLCCAGATLGLWFKAVRPTSVQGKSSLSQDYLSYLRETDDMVIQGSAQTAFIARDALAFEQGAYPANAIVPGGWMVYTAPWQDFLASRGLSDSDLLEQLAQRDDMTLVTGEDTAETVREFVEERLGRSVKKRSVRTFGDDAQLSVWKYSLA